MKAEDAEGEEESVLDDALEAGGANKKRIGAVRRTGTTAVLSGADDRSYAEFEARKAIKLANQSKNRNKLFTQRAKDLRMM
jgi:hypothetical protein